MFIYFNTCYELLQQRTVYFGYWLKRYQRVRILLGVSFDLQFDQILEPNRQHIRINSRILQFYLLLPLALIVKLFPGILQGSIIAKKSLV